MESGLKKVNSRLFYAMVKTGDFLTFDVKFANREWKTLPNKIAVPRVVSGITLDYWQISSVCFGENNNGFVVGTAAAGVNKYLVYSELDTTITPIASNWKLLEYGNTTYKYSPPIVLHNSYEKVATKTDEFYLLWACQNQESIGIYHAINIIPFPTPFLPPNTGVANLNFVEGKIEPAPKKPRANSGNWMSPTTKVVGSGCITFKNEEAKSPVSAISTPFGGIYFAWIAKENNLAFAALPHAASPVAVEGNFRQAFGYSLTTDPAGINPGYTNSYYRVNPISFGNTWGGQPAPKIPMLPQPPGPIASQPVMAMASGVRNHTGSKVIPESQQIAEAVTAGVFFGIPVIVVPLKTAFGNGRRVIAITAYVPTLYQADSTAQGFIPWATFNIESVSRNFVLTGSGDTLLLSYEVMNSAAIAQKKIPVHHLPMRLVLDWDTSQPNSKPKMQLFLDFQNKSIVTIPAGDSWAINAGISNKDGAMEFNFLHSTLDVNAQDTDSSEITVYTLRPTPDPSPSDEETEA